MDLMAPLKPLSATFQEPFEALFQADLSAHVVAH